MEETVKDRLMLFIKEKGLSQKRFEEAAHISNGYVNNLKASPSSKVLQKIFYAFPDLSQSWLLTGEGPMLNDKKPSEQSAGLPLIPVNFMAGALSGVDGRWMDYECDHFTVPGFESADFLITVMGDSMQPTLVSGIRGATMLLNAGVDMETVAKILGHSSTRITRSTYAKLLDDTVGREMEKAEEKER